MQKKRLSTKVLSAVLSLLMILTVIPLVPLAPTADAATTEYNVPSGTTFVKDVFIAASGSSSNAAISELSGYATVVVTKELNTGCTSWGQRNGDYIYIGYSTTTNPAEAVRGLRLDHEGSNPNSYTGNGDSGVRWDRVNLGSGYAAYHPDGSVDLNKGCGSDSDDITLYVTKDPSFGDPVTDVAVSLNTTERDNYNSNGYKPVVSFQDNTYNVDVNKGAGGNDIFLHYKTRSVSTVTTAALRAAFNNTAQFMGVSGYTPVSIGTLSSARTKANNIISAFDNNNGCASYTQKQIDDAATEINNAVNNLKTYLYLDGMTNGGTANQTIELTVGKNTSLTVNLGDYSATKAGADFVGWAKNSLDTEGTKGTVTVGFNETYYALFGVELTANFHYLNTDGTYKVETKKIYAMNSANAASTPKPSVKNATYDGRTFEFLGWREDTVAAEATISKSGIYTVYTVKPVVDVYAVYSSDITFTQDANKGTPTVEDQKQTQYLNANSNITVTSHEFTVTDVTPEREGGKFLGWADDAIATAKKYSAGDKLTLTSNKTIYAAYEMDMWTVTFIGDNNEVIDTQTIAHGNDAVYPEAIPTKDYDENYHYSFANWDKTLEELAVIKTDIIVNAVFTATEHDYVVTVNTAPDCLNAGEDHYACDCGYEKDVAVDALGHDIILNPGHEATCTMDGATDEKTCGRCLLVLQVKEVIPALGHDYQLYEEKTATCNVGGYEIYVCKNNPNHKETRNVVPPSSAHEIKTVEGYEVTCLTNGLTDGIVCKNCECVLVEQGVILADGHKLVTGEDEKYIAPTCEEKGRTQGKHCSVCNLVIVETEEIPALGHDWADFVAKPATCTEAGYTAGSKCRRCHDVKDSTEIPALNHGENGYTVIVHEATCTEDGYTEYICDYDTKHNYKENGEAATGHEGGTATCKDKAICTKCGEAYGNTIAHSYDSVVFPATCTKKGYTEFTCTVCGDSYQGDETPLAAHKYDDGKITTAPTCCDAGVKTFTCINCSEASYTEAVAATGHTVTDWTVEGTEATGSCDDCGETITANPEDVGLELPECERCGMVHKYNSGLFKYKGIYCSIIYFFRQIANFFKGNA